MTDKEKIEALAGALVALIHGADTDIGITAMYECDLLPRTEELTIGDYWLMRLAKDPHRRARMGVALDAWIAHTGEANAQYMKERQ